MGLNVFTLFVGFGLGSLIFSAALQLGLNVALAIFGAVIFLAGMTALHFFRSEMSSSRQAS